MEQVKIFSCDSSAKFPQLEQEANAWLTGQGEAVFISRQTVYADGTFVIVFFYRVQD